MTADALPYLWALDLNPGHGWTRINTYELGRVNASSWPIAGGFVMFGGSNGTSLRNDAYFFDYTSQNFIQISGTTAPTARQLSLVWGNSQQMLVYGGWGRTYYGIL